jgi:hypothetical protein
MSQGNGSGVEAVPYIIRNESIVLVGTEASCSLVQELWCQDDW